MENDDEAKRLEISLYDKLIDAEIKLLYTVYEKFNVITRSAKFINHGEENINLSRVLSASVDFLDSDFEMIQLSGAWSRERHGHSRKLAPGIQRISSKGMTIRLHSETGLWMNGNCQMESRHLRKRLRQWGLISGYSSNRRWYPKSVSRIRRIQIELFMNPEAIAHTVEINMFSVFSEKKWSIIFIKEWQLYWEMHPFPM